MIATARTLHRTTRYPMRDPDNGRISVFCGRCMPTAAQAQYRRTTADKPELTACSTCGQPLVSPRKDR